MNKIIYTSEKWNQAYITFCSLLFLFSVVLSLSAAEYKALIRLPHFYPMFNRMARPHFISHSLLEDIQTSLLFAAANDAETTIFWKDLWLCLGIPFTFP